MSSWVDSTPSTGAEAAEGGDRPPPPRHRSQTTAVLDGPTASLDGAAHRTALLAATLAADEEPPFLQEPTVAMPTAPPVPLAERISELAYQRRAAAAVVLAVLVLAAAALVTRGPGETADGGRPPTSLADGGAALMGPVRLALAAFGSSTRVAPSTFASGAAGSAGADDTTTTQSEATTTASTAPTTAATEPAATAPPGTTPDTVQPRFCTVWVDRAATVLAQPDDDAETVGSVGLGLYWVSAVTEERPRWYLIDDGSIRGWVSGDDVDRQGDCGRRR